MTMDYLLSTDRSATIQIFPNSYKMEHVFKVKRKTVGLQTEWPVLHGKTRETGTSQGPSIFGVSADQTQTF